MRTVFKALSAVQKELSERGIAKGDTNTFDNYKFRGIDAVLNALAPILAKNGLVLVPSLDESEIRTVPASSGKAMNHCKVKMSFTFYDSEGDFISHTFHGEAMDRGDKSLNKAATAAYKYFLFQAFTIPVEGTPDADNESHEVGDAVDDRKQAHDAALAKHLDSVQAIQTALIEADSAASDFDAEQCYFTAYEAWSEIPEQDKISLYLAPSKGGSFTTRQRAQMKSDEWGAARRQFHGEEQAA